MALPFHDDHSVLRDYVAFTDESGIGGGDRYLLIGGVSCRTAFAHTIERQISDIISRPPYPGDTLEWKAYRAKKAEKYQALLDLFLKLNDDHLMDFSCVVADSTQFAHAEFNDGDGETMFQKLMYQTYMTVLKKYHRPAILRGFHGQRDCAVPLRTFQNIFNAGVSSRYGRGPRPYMPLLQMEYMAVSKSPLHQMSDMILGAISWHRNRRNKLRGPATSPKGRFAMRVQAECPLESLALDSPRGTTHMNIWTIKLRARRPRL